MNIPFYRFVEVALYSLLNLMPFLVLALYLFRKNLAHRSFREWCRARLQGEL